MKDRYTTVVQELLLPRGLKQWSRNEQNRTEISQLAPSSSRLDHSFIKLTYFFVLRRYADIVQNK